MVNLKRLRRKRYYTSILSGGPEENMKTSVGIASDPADIRAGHILNTRQSFAAGGEKEQRTKYVDVREEGKGSNSTAWIQFIWPRLGASGGFL
jgi:hypothetical protein